jgi:hypothetical protein
MAEQIDQTTAPLAATGLAAAPHLVVVSKRLWRLVLVGGAAIWLLAAAVTEATDDDVLVPLVIDVGSFLVPVTVVAFALSRRDRHVHRRGRHRGAGEGRRPARHRLSRPYREPRNGMVLGAIVGAGFASFESAGYAGRDADRARRRQPDREQALLAPFGHITWTACSAARCSPAPATARSA